MFSKHVTKFLSAYCQHELSAAEAQRVQAHLQECAACRDEHEEIKLGIQLAAQLQVTPAPDSLWPEVVKELNVRPKQKEPVAMWKWALAAGVALLLVIGGWYGIQLSRINRDQREQQAEKKEEKSLPEVPQRANTPWPSVSPQTGDPQLGTTGEPKPPVLPGGVTPAWEVARVEGAPKIGGAQIQNKGKLAVGEWLETDNASKAQIKVAEIGYVDVDPNTRVQLVRTKQTEHRINLAKGKMSAFIVAPPRLFVVDTPSATAVDLGCAYTLEVDEYGASLLHVTSGWVSLVLQGHEAIIPAGAMCATRKGVGVGTPYFADATATFKAALTKIDFETKVSLQETVGVLLSQARLQDTLTLWHLLARQYREETEEIRGRIFDRLAELAPPPEGVTREGIIKGNRKMLDLWWGGKSQ